jgi:hypothetical protein
MPGDPNDCRMRARRCSELAAESNDANLKKKFVDLANQWTKLAADLESAQALTGKTLRRPPAYRRGGTIEFLEARYER